MFKAIGRWGAQVKSRIRIPFLTNLFASKNKDYSGIDDDEEEIFIDAKEDLNELSETEEELVLTKKTGNGHLASNGGISEVPSSSSADAVTADTTDTSIGGASGKQLVDITVNRTDTDSSQDEDSKKSEHSDNEEDDHHDSHHDKKKIIRSESKTNGMAKSPSTSTFKKVHRRISSLTQKQYTKLDNNNSDDVDNLIHHEADDSQTNEITEVTDERRTEKKPSRRKKIAKRTRKSVRGSWKWMKRGLMGYARAFNTPTFFVINVTGASAARKY